MGKSASSKAVAKATAMKKVKKDDGVQSKSRKPALKKVSSAKVKKDDDVQSQSRKSALKKVSFEKAAKAVAVGKKGLDALGSMSLSDKVGKALEKADDEVTAASLLKDSLDKREHSRIWNQYNAAKQKDPSIEDTLAKGKKEKGMAAALWFVKQNKPKFLGMSMTMQSNEKIQMKDEWCTEKQMNDKFGAELQAHINSGRVLWRIDPFTRDCYQYKDQGDISRIRELNKGKLVQTNQEYEADDEQQDFFKELFDQDLLHFTKYCKLFLVSTINFCIELY